jgi:GNAT superfamily N-acetyltransferase
MTNKQGVEPRILNAWLSARSIVRRLPPPVPEHGGFRVDTNSDAEISRWVFPVNCPGIESLARTITQPRYLLKLCGSSCELRRLLPEGWGVHASGFFMISNGKIFESDLVDGYSIETRRCGPVVEARIYAFTGGLAASGYAAETRDAFVYDRIATEPQHRRKGLGRTLMATLRKHKLHTDAPDLLVATAEGRALYATLGWEMISPYSTASILSL